MMASELQDFTALVLHAMFTRPLPLAATNDCGDSPVIPCLDSDPIREILDTVYNAGGYATVFSRSVSGCGPHAAVDESQIRCVAFVNADTHLDAEATEMTSFHVPHPLETVGSLLDYLEENPHGVRLPRELGLKATGITPVRSMSPRDFGGPLLHPPAQPRYRPPRPPRVRRGGSLRVRSRQGTAQVRFRGGSAPAHWRGGGSRVAPRMGAWARNAVARGRRRPPSK